MRTTLLATEAEDAQIDVHSSTVDLEAGSHPPLKCWWSNPAIIYLLFAMSGAAALIYEVMWMRRFRLVFGSSSQSAAVVLAAFFGGMAIGNFLGIRLAKRTNSIRIYGWLEFAVGALALLVSSWLMLYHAIYPFGYDWLRAFPGMLSIGKLALAAVALLPPTVAMGATLPILTGAIVDHPDRVARRTGRLYGWNIFGAVVGALFAGFYLPLRVGVGGTIYVAVALNWLVAVAALVLSRGWSPPVAVHTGDGSQRFQFRRPASILLAAAAVSGFGSLALEVVYVRILAQRTDGSVYAFALMLAIFLLSLSAGAWVAGRWLDRRAAWPFLAGTQLAAAICIPLSTMLFHYLVFFAAVTPNDSYAIHMFKVAAAGLLLLGAPVVLIGTVLPWTWKMASRSEENVGRIVGILTGVNTIAAVAGSLLAGFVLLPALGVGGTALCVAGLYGALAAGGFWQLQSRAARWLGIGASVLVLAVWYSTGVWRSNFQPLRENEKLVQYRETADASVAVIQRAGRHMALKVNHEYLLGSSLAAERELRQGRLPLLLHPAPRRVAFIGAATGISCAAALDFPIQQIVAIELLPGVAETLPLFEQWNGAFYDDPRTELVVDDGRNYMLGTRDEFDVIVSDLFVPWHAGTGDLYSVEHFRSVKQRLAPGGIFAQWLPGYQVTVDELRIIAATFLAVFPDATLWRNDFDPRYPLVCLVGYRDGLVIDPASIAAGRSQIADTELMHDALLPTPGGLEMLFVCGGRELQEWARGAPLNTDEHPIIEFTTPMSFLKHRQSQNVASIQDMLASFRPRDWCYPEEPTPSVPVRDACRAADLVHEAAIAGAKKDQRRELELLLQLEEFVDELPAIGLHLTRAAAGYRQKQMDQENEALLTALIRHEGAPPEALVAMAAGRKAAGEEEEAIEYLEQAVERAPEEAEVRKELVDLLTNEGKYAQLEPHLQVLLQGTPDDPYLRLDLMRALDRQGKTAAARAQLDEFRTRWDGKDGQAVWRYLRSLGLGPYVDAAPPLDMSTAPQ